MASYDPKTLLHEGDYLLHLLGRCVSQWSHVEDSLCVLFTAALGLNDNKELSTNRLAASAAYYAAINFETKLSITNAAVAIRIMRMPVEERPTMEKEFGRLFRHIGNQGRTRNRIVHFQTLSDVLPDGDIRTKLRPRLFDPNNISRYTEKSMPQYRTHDLERVAQVFGLLSIKIRACAKRLEQH